MTELSVSLNKDPVYVCEKESKRRRKRKVGVEDDDILARGELLRMIGDNHLLEEGALALKQSLFGKCKLSPTWGRREEKRKKGSKREKG